MGQLREAAAAAARDRRATLLDRARRLSDDVAAGVYRINYEYCEDDDYGYWDEDWELADPDGLADDLAALLDEAVDAVAHNGHATGLAVLDRLWDIQIETDYDDVGVAELIAESQDGPPLGDILTAWAAAAVHELRGDARVARVAEAARHAHTGLDLAQVLGAAAVGEDEAKRFLADWRGADEPDATDLADLPVQPVIGFDYPGYGVAVNLLPGEDPDPDIMARLAQLRAILDQAALDYQAANG